MLATVLQFHVTETHNWLLFLFFNVGETITILSLLEKRKSNSNFFVSPLLSLSEIVTEEGYNLIYINIAEKELVRTVRL